MNKYVNIINNDKEFALFIFNIIKNNRKRFFDYTINHFSVIEFDNNEIVCILQQDNTSNKYCTIVKNDYLDRYYRNFKRKEKIKMLNLN